MNKNMRPEGQANSIAQPRVLMGIGNIFGGDDGVGPYLAGLLAGSAWISLDCGTAPEHFTAHLRRLKPALVVLADAAVMGLPPGSVRRIDPALVGGASFTTHTLPLSLLVRFIREDGPAVILLGIEPENLSPVDTLSDTVRASADALAQTLLTGDITEIPCLE